VAGGKFCGPPVWAQPHRITISAALTAIIGLTHFMATYTCMEVSF